MRDTVELPSLLCSLRLLYTLYLLAKDGFEPNQPQSMSAHEKKYDLQKLFISPVWIKGYSPHIGVQHIYRSMS